MRTLITSLLVMLVAPGCAPQRLPIIDMHLHAMAVDTEGPPPVGICAPIEQLPTWDPSRPFEAAFMELKKAPPCDDPVWSPETDEALMQRTIEMMERYNIIGVLSGHPDRVAAWRKAAPGRFMPALEFMLGQSDITPDSIRQMHGRGDVAVLGEVLNQYAGIAPGDERMEPFWAVAEELDIPVGIHIGLGPPGAAYLAGGYRVRLASALTLEEVLVRHPRLRVYHACRLPDA